MFLSACANPRACRLDLIRTRFVFTVQKLDKADEKGPLINCYAYIDYLEIEFTGTHGTGRLGEQLHCMIPHAAST